MSRHGEIDAVQHQMRQQVDAIKQNKYYQKIQQDLAAKRVRESHQIVELTPKIDIQDKVNIQNFFVWMKDQVGNFRVRPREQMQAFNEKEALINANHILKTLGYQINLTDKVEYLKDIFKKLYIEARSHNVLLSKFNEVRYAFLIRVLTAMGVSTKEIQDLQKEALESGIDKNLELFSQNEYNEALYKMFGKSRKDRGKLIIFRETRDQLITQMKAMGMNDFYSQERTLTIRRQQYQKIKEELQKELSNLEYLRDYTYPEIKTDFAS